jgi:hypothetical protein
MKLEYYAIITVLTAIIVVPFSIMWYDHTGFVQEMVREDIAEYQEVVPNWIDLQDTDPAQVNQLAIRAISNMNFTMSGSWQLDESHEYRRSLYNVMAAVIHNSPDLNETLQVAAQMYEAWLSANTYFVENRLYAMRYTF